MTERDAMTPSRRDLIELVALGGLGALALWSYRSSYGGTEFFVVGVAFLVGSLVIGHVGQRLPLPAPVTGAILTALYAIVGGVVAMPGRAINGVLPSPDSALTALRMVVTGWKQLLTTAPPVGRTGDLFVIPVLVGVATGGPSLLLARRFPRASLLAVAPAAIALGLGIAVGDTEPVSVILHGGVFGAVTFGWMAWRAHIRRPLLEGSSQRRSQLVAAAAVLAVAGAAGTVGYTSLPARGDDTRDIWRDTVTPPFDPQSLPSPLSGYRQYVKAPSGPDGEDKVVFTVEGLPEGVPVRLATMDAFDGLVWQVSSGRVGEASLGSSGSFERIGTRLEPDVPGELATVTITIGEYYRDFWVPDVGEVLELRFVGSADGPARDRQLARQFRYNRTTDTAASRAGLKAGDRYEMVVRLPVLLENLSGEVIIPPERSLPESASGGSVTTNYSPEVAAIADTGDKLDFIRDRFVDAGTYSDGDREANQIVAEAGHSSARLERFVATFPTLIGNAEQYAAAYAVLFRDLRVPTRVVMGFVPPAASIDEPVDVWATNVEAWVEVPVEDKGWVAIFPTPPRDQTAIMSTAPQQPEPDYRTQNPPPPPLTDPEFEQPATAAGDAIPPSSTVPPDTGGSDDPPVSVPAWAPSALLVSSPALVFFAFALLIALLKKRRASRRRRAGLPHERVLNGWREVTDFAVDSGRPVPKDMTRREAAGFVGSSTHELARRADAVVWGAGEPDQATVDAYWHDLTMALRAMRSELPVKDRLKTALSIESFKAERVRRKEKVHA